MTRGGVDSLTALGNLHLPPVATPQPNILHEDHSLDIADLTNASVVLLELCLVRKPLMAVGTGDSLSRGWLRLDRAHLLVERDH